MTQRSLSHRPTADLSVLTIVFDTQSCTASLRCVDPAGQIYQLRLTCWWFFGHPELSTRQAECNGDQVQGIEIAEQHFDQLHQLIRREYLRLIASGTASQGKPPRSARFAA